MAFYSRHQLPGDSRRGRRVRAGSPSTAGAALTRMRWSASSASIARTREALASDSPSHSPRPPSSAPTLIPGHPPRRHQPHRGRADLPARDRSRAGPRTWRPANGPPSFGGRSRSRARCRPGSTTPAPARDRGCASDTGASTGPRSGPAALGPTSILRRGGLASRFVSPGPGLRDGDRPRAGGFRARGLGGLGGSRARRSWRSGVVRDAIARLAAVVALGALARSPLAPTTLRACPCRLPCESGEPSRSPCAGRQTGPGCSSGGTRGRIAPLGTTQATSTASRRPDRAQRAADLKLREASGFRNPGVFDYAAHLAREGITSSTGRATGYRPEPADPWPVRVKRRAGKSWTPRCHPPRPPSSADSAGDRAGAAARGGHARRAGVYHVPAVGLHVAPSPRPSSRSLAMARAWGSGGGDTAMQWSSRSPVWWDPGHRSCAAAIVGVLVLAALPLEREASVLNGLPRRPGHPRRAPRRSL
jgi:hypothetical protein